MRRINAFLFLQETLTRLYIGRDKSRPYKSLLTNYIKLFSKSLIAFLYLS